MKNFLLLITALFILAGINSLNAQVVLAKGATWKYLDDGSDQGTAWYDAGFDDSGWDSGTALLGYGDIKGDPIVDTLSYGPDGENKYTTTYFRTTFDYTPTGSEIGYVINLLIDDGAVFYFNGVEAARWNMPRDSLNYTTFSVGYGNEYWGEFLLLDKSHIVSGTNTLAVELHQGDAGSSDLGFDMELVVDPGDLFPDNKYFIMDAVDDGEEEVANGAVDLGSSDLELATDGGDAQIIGMRFSNILVDPGETVSSASIQFTSDGSSSDTVSLKIEGEKIADSPFFTETDSNFSSRTRTTANVSWSPPDWAADTAGAEQKTPDLATIVQEIIDLPGWASGNHMTFFISLIDGAAKRPAFTKTAQNDSGTSAVLEILTGSTAIRVVGERENLISVYPNPAEDYFYIDNPTSEIFSYRVRNITGQLLRQGDHISGNRATIHLDQSGLYIVEVRFADKVYTQKVIMR
jgi:hypothetical protein